MAGHAIESNIAFKEGLSSWMRWGRESRSSSFAGGIREHAVSFTPITMIIGCSDAVTIEPSGPSIPSKRPIFERNGC